MPRSFGGGNRSGGRSFGAAPRTQTRPQPQQQRPASAAPPPAPAAAAAPQQVPMAGAQPGRPGLLGTMAEGMAFGAGSAVAHRAVDSVLGPRTVQHEFVNAPGAEGGAAAGVAGTTAVGAFAASAGRGPCADFSSQLEECMRTNNGNVGACQFYFDALSKCQRESQ